MHMQIVVLVCTFYDTTASCSQFYLKVGIKIIYTIFLIFFSTLSLLLYAV